MLFAELFDVRDPGYCVSKGGRLKADKDSLSFKIDSLVIDQLVGIEVFDRDSPVGIPSSIGTSPVIFTDNRAVNQL